MRKESEIKERLEQVKKDLEHANEWHHQAYIKYIEEERKNWGKDADRGEMDAASDAATNCANEIRLLEWVLADVKPRIPIKINTDEGDE
jgi:hypothetical protein